MWSSNGLRFRHLRTAGAQEVPDHVKQRLEWMLGNWESTNTWDGTESHSINTTRRSDDNAGVVIEFTTFDSRGSVDGLESVCWDDTLNAVVYHGVTSRGDYWKVVYDKHAEDEWSGHGTGRWSEGVWDSDTRLEWATDGFRYEDETQGKPFVIVGRKRAQAADLWNST